MPGALQKQGNQPSGPPGLKPGGSTVMRPSLARPAVALPSRPVQLSTNNLMPPPKVKSENWKCFKSKISFSFQAPGLIIKKSSGSYSSAGDDDINDVAAMGGVNVADEASKIGSSDIGSLIRSCKDEAFLQTGFLSQKVARICKEKVSEASSLSPF